MKSIRFKALFAFISFSLILFLMFIVVNNHYQKRREQKRRLIERFADLEVSFVNVQLNVNSFYNKETTNPHFFTTGNSCYISSNDSIIKHIIREIHQLDELAGEQGIPIGEESEIILNDLKEYEIKLKKLVSLVLERGYKDYNIEGDMRREIHKLELLETVSQVEVLMMRRHEKDYIIRGEPQYIDKLNQRAVQFKRQVAASKKIDEIQKDSILVIISRYQELFNLIVSLDDQIGNKNNSGIKSETDNLSQKIEADIVNLRTKTETRHLAQLKQAKIAYLGQMFLAIVLSIVMSFLITKRITCSLIELTDYIALVTKNDLAVNGYKFSKNVDSEVKIIYDEFNKMIDHLIRKDQQRNEAIEEMKAAKIKAEESDRLKSAFLANMSHEIRTPMNAIIGFSELLTFDYADESSRNEYINQIKNSGELLLRIIDDIIDISKIEAGEISLHIEYFDINATLDDITLQSMASISVTGKEILFSMEKGIESPAIVRSDQIRIRQILGNLIGNAIKFTSSGSITAGYIHESGTLKFYVSDTGIGIPTDKTEIIFERFRQGEESLTRNYGGTGLGLSIARHLVELLGGTIFVESETGKGSTFWFTIPYTPFQANQEKSEPSIPNLSTEPDWSKKYLLIAEDNSASRALLVEFLKPTRINALLASNGKEALGLFSDASNNVDLILLDIQMPLLNGIQVTRMIREIDKGVPIIAQTAYALEEEKQMCLAAGCSDHISKPIKRGELLKIMKKYLS
jgi:signal transduction histidine kinase